MKSSKHLIKYAIFGCLLVMVCFFFVKSCTLTDRYSAKIGEYNALLQVHEQYKQGALEAILKARDYISGLIAKNDEIAKRVKSTELQIVAKNGKLLQLNRELVKAQNTGDKDAQISNLESQLNIWKVKFTLAEKIIEDKDNIIFNLKQQYDKQVNITIDIEKLYGQSQDLLRRNEVLLNITQRKLRTAKGGSTFKTVALGVLGGFVAYKLIKD